QQDADTSIHISAEVFGFVPPERLLVHRHNDRYNVDGFEVWDARANRRIKLLQVPPFDKSSRSVTVSPDGLTLAIAARGEKAGIAASDQPTLYLYDVSAGANNNIKTRQAIAPLKTSGPVRPTGMTFASDGSRLALLFEENGNGLLVIFSYSGGRLTLQFQRQY